MPAKTDAFGMTQEQIELSRALGPPGPPDLHTIMNNIGSSANDKTKKVDLLGRVVEVTEQKAIGARPVTIMRDTLLTYPELYLQVFVVNGEPNDETMFAKMFARARCRQAKTLLEADLAVFTGGADVDPQLYGETAHSSTCIDPSRDNNEMNTYLFCREEGIPMLGICRGAQFLHVMHGGKLYQDVDGHQESHPMWDSRKKFSIDRVSSVHHQMVIENKAGGMEILGIAGRSNKRWLNATDVVSGRKSDIEAFWYPETVSIGIQGHPEYTGYPRFTQWTFELLDELICQNPAVEYINSVRRRKNRETASITAKVVN